MSAVLPRIDVFVVRFNNCRNLHFVPREAIWRFSLPILHVARKVVIH